MRIMASSFLMFLDHTQRRTTVGRTTLEKWSARRRDLYLTTRNTHNRQTSTPPVGFEPTISAGERPQTYALDRAATGTGKVFLHIIGKYNSCSSLKYWTDIQPNITTEKLNSSTNLGEYLMSCCLEIPDCNICHWGPSEGGWLSEFSCATSSARYFSADEVENLVSSQRCAASRLPTSNIIP